MDPGLREKIAAFVAGERLPEAYTELAVTWIVPLADWLGKRRLERGSILLAGVHGGQGTGKTTVCRVLELLLAEAGYRCLTLSLDDFYLGRETREQLAKQVHPLLATRGVPGTHNIELLAKTLSAVASGEAVDLPRFNKAEDDREPRANWSKVKAGVDIVLLEGWCIGNLPQTEKELREPVNPLEADEDAEGVWRRYVNTCLAGNYRALFEQLHCLVMLCAPSMEAVLEWRTLQESKLAGQGGSRVMSEQEVQRFVQHYERLTRHALAEMPARADYLLQLDREHNFTEAIVR